MIHTQIVLDFLFARDLYTGGESEAVSPSEMASYIRDLPTGMAMVFSIGKTPERAMLVREAAARQPRFVSWEFGDGDDVEGVLSAFSSVKTISVSFSDGRMTADRLDLLCAEARGRYARGSEMTALNMTQPQFREIVDALIDKSERFEAELKELKERFKTALVCVAARR
jgi:hypothetical protein